MDKADLRRVCTLLSKFYPNARQLKDRDTLAAWGLALADFPYEDVKTAVLDYAVRNKYFPDLSDLTAHLAQPAVPPRPSPRLGATGWAEHRALYDRWRAEEDRLAPLRAAAGLPGTWAEAEAACMTCTQWYGLLARQGLSSADFPKEVCPHASR